VTPAIKKKLKRRNTVEPVIGHMKNDGRLGRNFLKGVAGDAINALVCGADHNLRKILRQLALLFAHIRQLFYDSDSNQFSTAINI
jgi:IS5 family transposase